VHIANRKSLESLIKSGAFDSFGERSRLANNVDHILAYASKLQKERDSGQVDLFGESTTAGSTTLKLSWDDSLPEIPLNEQLIWERELLGLYLSHHPLKEFETYLLENTHPIIGIKAHMEGQSIKLGGTITDIREITTKNGAKMAFVKVADTLGEIELVVFPKVYLDAQILLQRDYVIIAKGKLGSGRGSGGNSSAELKLLADKIELITQEKIKNYKPKGELYDVNTKTKKAALSRSSPKASELAARQRLYIRLENSEDQPLLMALKEKLDGYKGDTEVVLVTGPTASKQIIKLPQTVSVNEESLRDLASVFGALNVVVR
jgi:DNA polymerase III alpha subunit